MPLHVAGGAGGAGVGAGVGGTLYVDAATVLPFTADFVAVGVVVTVRPRGFGTTRVGVGAVTPASFLPVPQRASPQAAHSLVAEHSELCALL